MGLGICMILYLCWFTNHFIAYATIFNATNFGSNLYLNMTIFTTASFGANTMLYLVIERLKRRTLSRVAYSFMIFSCFCLALSFYFEDQEKAALAKSIYSSNSTNLGTNLAMNEEEAREAALHAKQLEDIYHKYNIDLRNISIAAVKAATKPKEEGHIRLWLGM